MTASRRPSVVLDLSKAVSFEPSERRNSSKAALTSRVRLAWGTLADVSRRRRPRTTS